MTRRVPLGAVVIGTGFGARVVAPAFAATDGVEVVAVVSPRDERAIATAVADPRVALVSVHSPPFMHERHVRMALEAGRSVLCDKPFTPSAETSRQLADDARDVPGMHLLNFEFRFDPLRRRARELVNRGALGSVEHVEWTHLSAGSRHPLRPYGWLFDRERGGGWIGAWASHAIDTLRVSVGEIQRVVHSQPRLAVTHRPDPADAAAPWRECTAEDGLSALLTMRDGASVTIDSSFAASANVPPRLTIVGGDATVEIVADRRLTVRNAAGVDESLTMTVDDVRADHHAGPMYALAAAVADAVRTGDVASPLATFADGVACDEILDLLRAAPVRPR